MNIAIIKRCGGLSNFFFSLILVNAVGLGLCITDDDYEWKKKIEKIYPEIELDTHALKTRSLCACVCVGRSFIHSFIYPSFNSIQLSIRILIPIFFFIFLLFVFIFFSLFKFFVVVLLLKKICNYNNNNDDENENDADDDDASSTIRAWQLINTAKNNTYIQAVYHHHHHHHDYSHSSYRYKRQQQDSI